MQKRMSSLADSASPSVAPGLALPHCRVGWAGSPSPGMSGRTLDVAPGLALPYGHVGWAGALSPGMS